MPVDPEGIQTFQLALFDLEKYSSSSFELFPKVWVAVEALTDGNLANRQASLDCLEELNAARYSPLVAYILFTRLTDPDLTIRTRVVKILADVLRPDSQGQFAPDQVRQNVLFHLSRMQPSEIYALLETAEFDPDSVAAITALLKADHQAGLELTTCVNDRKTSLRIRKQALQFIAHVGYLDAAPGIERLINRLEARVNGQQSFVVNPAETAEETELLPILQSVLRGLRAP
jgi:hypothetical protein